MCGIAGLVRLEDAELDARLLANMMDIVHYRGPDGQGFALFSHDDATVRTGNDSATLRNGQWPRIDVALGHRRLAIIDLSAAANQPMSYEDERYWIVFNGAIYNYVELRQELQSAGLPFRTTSDTEVILAAYRHWGLHCVDHFNGMFAIAIFDRTKRRVVCFRDRLGIKPFYYTLSDGIFRFASEIKQLLEAGAPRKVNPRLVFDYVISGTTDHCQETCFESVQQLLPSHRLVIQFANGRGKMETARYWQPERRTEHRTLSLESASEQVADLLMDSVKLRMRCDVPLGSCLSGGLDSSSVVTLMAANRKALQQDTPQHTFTYQPDEALIDESHFAKIVSDHVGAESHVTRIDPDELIRLLDTHLWHEEEPIANLSHFARARVMALAKQVGVTVVLDGQGGDELFLGYERYYVPAFLTFLRDYGPFKAFREFWLATRHSKLGMSRLLLYAFLFGNTRVRAMYFKRRASGWMNPSFLKQNDVLEVARTHHLGLDTWEMQRRDMLEIQLPHLLRHEDRDSMASSIEARTPLLDHRLVEFVMSLGLHTKIHDGWTKLVLRHAMRAHLPSEILWRRDKLGFAVPQSKWTTALHAHARQQLTGDLACESFVDAAQVRKRIHDGRIDSHTLWRIMSLEKMMRIFELQA